MSQNNRNLQLPAVFIDMAHCAVCHTRMQHSFQWPDMMWKAERGVYETPTPAIAPKSREIKREPKKKNRGETELFPAVGRQKVWMKSVEAHEREGGWRGWRMKIIYKSSSRYCSFAADVFKGFRLMSSGLGSISLSIMRHWCSSIDRCLWLKMYSSKYFYFFIFFLKKEELIDKSWFRLSFSSFCLDVCVICPKLYVYTCQSWVWVAVMCGDAIGP